jgi:hypothetical protein
MINTDEKVSFVSLLGGRINEVVLGKKVLILDGSNWGIEATIFGPKRFRVNVERIIRIEIKPTDYGVNHIVKPISMWGGGRITVPQKKFYVRYKDVRVYYEREVGNIDEFIVTDTCDISSLANNLLMAGFQTLANAAAPGLVPFWAVYDYASACHPKYNYRDIPTEFDANYYSSFFFNWHAIILEMFPMSVEAIISEIPLKVLKSGEHEITFYLIFGNPQLLGISHLGIELKVPIIAIE